MRMTPSKVPLGLDGVASESCPPGREPVRGSRVVYAAISDDDVEAGMALARGATRRRGPLGISEWRTIVRTVSRVDPIFGIDAG